MPYLALFLALAETSASFAPGPHLDRILWSPETLSLAEPMDVTRAGVLRGADALLGVPYHYAGLGPGHCPSGEHAACCDCSGLVRLAYAAAGLETPRTSAALAGAGRSATRAEMRPGDILIFRSDGSRNGQANHSGVYIGSGLFIHAGSRGVRLDDLDGPYWGNARRPRLRDIRRVEGDG